MMDWFLGWLLDPSWRSILFITSPGLVLFGLGILKPTWAIWWLGFISGGLILFLIAGIIVAAIDLPRLWDEKDEAWAKKGEANPWDYRLPF